MKNQLKKSLSLLMAVIMLMSCWVWVAPEKAEAATQNYRVEVKYEITNFCENGGHLVVHYWTFNSDGTVNTGSTASKAFVSSFADAEEGSYTKEDTVPGFPYKIEFKCYASGAYVGEGAVTSITVGDRLVSGNVDRLTAKDTTIYIGINANGVQEGTWGSATADWPLPKFGLDEENSTTDLDITTLPGEGTAKFAFKDVNYNTAWPHTVTQNSPSIVLAADGKTKTGVSASVASSTSTKVSFTTGADQHNPGNTDSSWKLTTSFKSGNVTITPSVNVLFTHPEYTHTFDPNGGKLDASDSQEIKNVYGAKVGHIPTIGEYRGFQLEGFKDSDGKKLSEDTLIEGNKTWYANWAIKDVEVIFLSADNQIVTTLTAKYNRTLLEHFGTLAAINKAVADNAVGFPFNGDNQLVWSKDGVEYQFKGWRIVRAWDLDDKEVTTYNGQMYDTATIDAGGNPRNGIPLPGKVVVQAAYQPKDTKKYTVSFFGTQGEELSKKADYKYGEMITQPASPPTLASDETYDYAHIGWAKKVGGTKYYTVDENNKDKDGFNVIYVSKDTDSFPVEGNAEYVPVFRMTKIDYTITFVYYDDGYVEKTATVEGVHYGDKLSEIVPDGIKTSYTLGGKRYNFDSWYDFGNFVNIDNAECVGNMTFTMLYKPPVDAVYTINFFDKDGNLINAEANQFPHNSQVTAPSVGDGEGFAIPKTIETETSRFTFKEWSPEVKTTATADIEYRAIYEEQIYADISYYNDGKLIYELKGKENDLFVDGIIPEYNEEDYGIPSKEADEIGSYEFKGWLSSGGAVTPGTSKITGNMQLNADFETTYKEYEIKFVNEGTDVLTKKYHYGEEIEIPENQTKAEDKEYTYEFKAWSPDVSKVCHGDAVYTATYRRTPKYYKVTWFKDNKVELSHSNYTYNAKIHQAIINGPEAYGPATSGKEWAFKEWVQCNAKGQPVNAAGEIVAEKDAARFVRGQRIGDKDLYFYPVFEEIPLVHTVTFYMPVKDADGNETLKELGEAKIADGEHIDAYGEAFEVMAHKAPDEDYHYIIEKWVNTENNVKVDVIKGDISVKAVYSAKVHDKKLYELIVEPTCNVPGYGNYKCEADECTAIDYNVAIAPVADESAPEGQLYVGTDVWTLADFEAGIDYSDVKYVSPNTNIIVNAEDTGSQSIPWNMDAKLNRGVGKIEYYISDKVIDDLLTITDWTAVYNYEEYRDEVLETVLKEKNVSLLEYIGYNHGTVEERMKKAEIDREVDVLLSAYKANATDVLSNLNLVNGEEYIIYMKVSEREGAGVVNECYFSSGKINYGSTAANIYISGNGYGSKFCAAATLTISDDTDGLKVYIDGEEVALTDGKYICTAAGAHNVTVVDKHGNKTSKTFEVKGKHVYKNYIIAPTCENGGSLYDLCTVCGLKANEQPLAAIGHSYTVNYIDKAPSCVDNGYRTYVCDNNCGTKLVIKPTDDAAVIAQAKVAVDPEAEEIEWRDLTAKDIESLLATGVHTYAKVTDEDGKETDEDLWVIDSAPTCQVEGSKHKTCTKCGHKEIEPIAVDTVNGHKFYREKVTKAPTCTEKGEKTKKCRYEGCGYSVVVAELPALGHTAGDYKTITPATCEAEGSKILTCAVCKTNGEPTEIGEPIKDDKGNVTGYDGQAIKIDAIGHDWAISGKPELKEDNNYYQKYVCNNDANHVKEELVAGYEPPAAAVVTFKDGDTVVATFNKTVGETIIATAVTAPTKAADATKKYTFSHWEDAEGKEVKFPIEIKGDATYTAVYAEKFVNYTITYYREDNTVFKKTGYLHNGVSVKLENGPAKASDWEYNYTFEGWVMSDYKRDDNGNIVYETIEVDKYDENGNLLDEKDTIQKPVMEDKLVTETVTIAGKDINLKAKYTSSKRTYAVTYAYSDNDEFTYMVKAGDQAPDASDEFDIEKDYDTKYHYIFKGWNRTQQLAKVQSNIYTTPDFTPALHVYETPESRVLKEAATCTTKAVYTYTCDVCHYSFEKSEGEVPGHLWSEPDYDETTGVNTVECLRNCGAKQEDTRSFTVSFYKDAEDKDPISTSAYIKFGTTIDPLKIPAAPVKEDDEANTYTFKGWALKGDTAIVDVEKYQIRDNVEFVAVYEATARTYTVIFMYDAKNVIKSYTVSAGASAEYNGTTPVKAPNDNVHYTFSNWSGFTKADGLKVKVQNVYSNVKVYAEFTAVDHSYTARTETLGEATCVNGKGERQYCACGKYKDVITGEAKDHTWELVEHKDPENGQNGYNKYKCSDSYKVGCTATKTETIPYVNNDKLVQVTVMHNNAVKSGIKVEVIEKNNAVAVPVTGTTNANGVATLTVEKGKTYDCYVTVNGEKIQIALTESNGVLIGSYSYTDKGDCSCACHRDNFWGSIFRFFHKIIKLFTGEFKCCSNPDPMYG